MACLRKIYIDYLLDNLDKFTILSVADYTNHNLIVYSMLDDTLYFSTIPVSRKDELLEKVDYLTRHNLSCYYNLQLDLISYYNVSIYSEHGNLFISLHLEDEEINIPLNEKILNELLLNPKNKYLKDIVVSKLEDISKFLNNLSSETTLLLNIQNI